MSIIGGMILGLCIGMFAWWLADRVDIYIPESWAEKLKKWWMRRRGKEEAFLSGHISNIKTSNRALTSMELERIGEENMGWMGWLKEFKRECQKSPRSVLVFGSPVLARLIEIAERWEGDCRITPPCDKYGGGHSPTCPYSDEWEEQR